MARIELDDVSLTFQVRKRCRNTLKDLVTRQLLRKSNLPPTFMEVQALKGINLRIREGDRLGILGRNGAGKSTLLKTLAGIYPPTEGYRIVEGRISSLFEIAVGFEQEGTGWENINYRGYLQGETPTSIRAKTQEIADFSELGDFLNMPVRYYSAGMTVRLAFSIVTAIDPEILLVDEVLGVGDMAFQQKARQRMRDMMAKARLMVMVSHDMESLASICNRLIWLDKGSIRMEGPPAEVVTAYTAQMGGGKKKAG
jgi:ABC-type polysaccharide/polyol phosphate transport system ATPase subunit